MSYVKFYSHRTPAHAKELAEVLDTADTLKGVMVMTEENINRIAALVKDIHGTVRLGYQRGPYAYAGENFGLYLAQATESCEEILEIIRGSRNSAN